jgi:hypothetical protein
LTHDSRLTTGDDLITIADAAAGAKHRGPDGFDSPINVSHPSLEPTGRRLEEEARGQRSPSLALRALSD